MTDPTSQDLPERPFTPAEIEPPPPPLPSFFDLLRGAVVTVLLIPALPAIADARTSYNLVVSLGAIVVGVVVAILVGRRSRRPGPEHTLVLAGLVLAIGWLAPQATIGPVTLALGLCLGVAVGVWGGPQVVRGRRGLIGAGLGVALVVLLVAADGAHAAWWAALAAALVLAAMAALVFQRQHSAGSGTRTVTIGAVLLALLATGWVGATSPTITWFGDQISHGPRHLKAVALTFDDGPNSPYTEQIAEILEEHGGRGTFFMIGRALDDDPATARKLLKRDHQLAGHSFSHGRWRWLDPWYGEFVRTQRAFDRRLRFCPRYYRAPYGRHTPFVMRAAQRHGVRMVGWDVAAPEWHTTDAEALARRVLADVKPGSIVLLHDGMSGKHNADRSVVVEALPLILDGLERKHLAPVRLDELLGDTRDPTTSDSC